MRIVCIDIRCISEVSRAWNDPRFLQCIVYLYPNEVDAKSGKRIGGTGFLIGIPYNHKDYVPQGCPYFADPDESLYHWYAVTNAHVVNGIASMNIPPVLLSELTTRQ